MASPRPIIDVHVGGKDRPIRFGMAANAEFCDMRDVSLSALQKAAEAADEDESVLEEGEIDGREMQIGDVLAVIYVALKDGARKRAREGHQPPSPPRDWIQVADWIDEMSEARQKQLFETVMEHITAAGKSQAPAQEAPAESKREASRKEETAQARDRTTDRRRPRGE
jgi:hypothetical protein